MRVKILLTKHKLLIMNKITLKRLPFCLNIILIFFSYLNVNAQTADQAFKNIPNNVVQNAENKTVTKSNSVSNSALDQLDSASNKAFRSLKGIFKKKPKQPAVKTDSASQTQNNSSNSGNSANNTGNIAVMNVVTNPVSTPVTNTATITAYNNYDFRAGDKIIFEDNFSSDADGEFPAHWNLQEGQGVINKIDGLPSFVLSSTPGLRSYTLVSPLMTKPAYLTDNFSVEFDQYLNSSNNILSLFLFDNSGNVLGVVASGDNVHYSTGKVSSAKDLQTSTGLPLQTDSKLSNGLPASITGTLFYNTWHHIAIAYKNDQLKVYVDQFRVLVIPHCGFKPTALECRSNMYDADKPAVFKNFKIADGAQMNMLGSIMTTGKFITHGISFDVNKAIVKPESMGIIGDVVKQLQDNPTLNIEIDGHTDRDGDASANMTLSQQRADAVKDALMQAGIDAARLTSKGFGATKPIADNTTQSGKAENRRVEFIKM